MLISVDTQKCLPCVRGKAYSVWADLHSLFASCVFRRIRLRRLRVPIHDAVSGKMGRNVEWTRYESRWMRYRRWKSFSFFPVRECCSWRTCFPIWPEVNLSLLTCSSRDGRSVWRLLYIPLKARVCAAGLKYHIRKCQSVHQWLCLSSELHFPSLT